MKSNVSVQKLVTALGLLVTAAAVMLLVVEMVCRVFLPGWAPPKAQRVNFWQHDGLLGWAHRPLKVGRFEHMDFSVRVAINSMGLRDREYPLDGEGKRRILLLGDSFGWGWGVEQEETIDALIESRNDDVEIINASVAGYSTDQELLYLEHRGLGFRPELVLLLFHPNDVNGNVNSNKYYYEKPVFRWVGDELSLGNVPVPDRARDRFKRFALNRTYFLRTLYLTGERWRSPSSGTGERLSSSLAVTEALLLRMREVAATHDAELWLVGIPFPEKGAEKIIRHVARFAASQDFRYVSLERTFRKATRETMYRNTHHWNAHGQALAAAGIERALEKAGYLSGNRKGGP